MTQSNLLFNNYSINQVDRISIPANVSQQLRRKMLALYVPNRLRAKIIWKLIHYFDPMAKVLRVSNQTIGPSSRLEHFDWVRWTKKINQSLGGVKLVPAFYFPPQHRRKKCSALLFNAQGLPTVYAKKAWGKEEIKHTLREREAYLFCNRHNFQSFETPTFIYSDKFEGRYYNLFSVFPPDVSVAPNNWSQVYQLAWEELSSSTLQRRKLRNLSWWNDRRRWDNNWITAFELLERNEPETGYQFCSAHGDFSLWNTRVRSNRLYLFDWEKYETEAPLFLDPLYYIICREILLKKEKDGNTIMKSLNIEFTSISYLHPNLLDLLLVLIYLRIHNQDKKLIKVLDELTYMLILDNQLNDFFF